MLNFVDYNCLSIEERNMNRSAIEPVTVGSALDLEGVDWTLVADRLRRILRRTLVFMACKWADEVSCELGDVESDWAADLARVGVASLICRVRNIEFVCDLLDSFTSEVFAADVDVFTTVVDWFFFTLRIWTIDSSAVESSSTLFIVVVSSMIDIDAVWVWVIVVAAVVVFSLVIGFSTDFRRLVAATSVFSSSSSSCSISSSLFGVVDSCVLHIIDVLFIISACVDFRSVWLLFIVFVYVYIV